MKTILLFGAGKSATTLIDYLCSHAQGENWKVVVADADLQLALSKIKNATQASAISFDIVDEVKRKQAIDRADIVISLLPPHLHILVAKDCLSLKKNLLTASYIDEETRKIQAEIEKNDLLFLYESGLDPGIDHMSAMRIFDKIKKEGGRITGFRSHCGGLVAPSSDDNPWHYKISWNARNIVLAGKNGAHYIENGIEKRLSYAELFNPDRIIEVPGYGVLGWYPNRDSMVYREIYGLNDARTILRTTLRHPDFLYGWKNIVDLKMTDETKHYASGGRSLFELFKMHLDGIGFGEWLNQKLSKQLDETKKVLENLVELLETEKKVTGSGKEIKEDFLAADQDGNLRSFNVSEIKDNAAGYMTYRMHQANLTLKQLFYLGLDDKETRFNKEDCSPADILQFAMEKKLALGLHDKDMIIMMHEVEFDIPTGKSQIPKRETSTLIVEGEDNLHTAMAKTVGLPLGISAKLILSGKINSKGLHIPVLPEIYEPVMKELERYNIKFNVIIKE